MVPTSSLNKIAILTGPTATGKTGLAIELAQKHGKIEIINADSLLVYRDLNIGTAKPTLEERQQVPHHLIDIRDPHEGFTAGDFHCEAFRAIEDIHSRGNRALVVGGTGFYLKTLLYGLWPAPKSDPALREKLEKESQEELYQRLEKRDPESALRIGRNDRYRLIRALEMIELSGQSPSEMQAQAPKTPDPRFELWVLDRPNDEIYTRIETRTSAMIEQGLVDEVKTLSKRYTGQGQELPRPLQSVGYRETLAFLQGIAPEGRKIPPGFPGLKSEISLATRQLVKSQRTWFRGEKSSSWFTLDQDLPQLLEAWKKIYGET
jgi:tRNA dimethylallyltransferase